MVSEIDYESELEKQIEEQQQKINSPTEQSKRLRCNHNCKYGGGNTCSYPNAEYSNCYTVCAEWEFRSMLFSSKEARSIKLKEGE